MSARYGIGGLASCGECGELIALRESGVDGTHRWYHLGTDRAYCWRDPRHTETAYPAPDSAGASPVIGFITQCEVCPQRALLAVQTVGWVCPRCTDAFGHGTADCGLGSRPQQDSAEHNPMERLSGTLGQMLGKLHELGYIEPAVAGFGDVDIAQAEPVTPPAKTVLLPAEFNTPAGIAELLRHHGIAVEFAPARAAATEDDYPIAKVQG